MAAASRVLVTGASGVLGPAVVTALANEGWHVRVHSRRPPAARLFPDGVDTVTGDIADRCVLGRALREVSAVVHMAALVHANPATVPDSEYERVNVQMTGQLLAAATRMGVGRVVLASTVCVYGGNRGAALTEQSTPSPHTAYARTKLQAEQLVLATRGADGAAIGTAIRLAAIYGPRMRGNYVRLLRALAARRFVWIGPGTNRRALIYVEDAARALVLAAGHPRAAGGVFNASDGDAHTLREIVHAMCNALGRPVPRTRVPAGLARGAAAGFDWLAQSFGRPASLTAGVDKLLEDVCIDSTRIRQEIGFVPRAALAEGWREVVARLRSAGELR
jgi:UDP-glucose 4-epimerase